MKKLFLYAGILAGAMAFTACDEDFTDWADPQAYGQEDGVELVTATLENVAGDLSYENVGDTLPLVKITSVASEKEISKIVSKKLFLEGCEIPFTEDENNVLTVPVARLDSAIKVAYKSMAYLNRPLPLKVVGTAVDADGVGTQFTTNEAIVNFQTQELPAISETSQVYYIGGYNSWNLSSPTPMEKNEDGTFSIVLEIADGEWFCFAPQEAVDAGDWNMLFRAQANGDTSTSGFFNLDSNVGNSFNCETGGKYKFTVSPKDWYFTYAPYTEQLWYAGDANGWGFSPLVKVGDHFEGYYYIYLADNESTWGFKFTTTPDWNNPQYGAGDGEGVIAIDGGNCNLPSGNESGFYKLLVNTDALTFSVEPIAQMSLIGSAIGANAWSDDFDLTFNTETMAWEGTYAVNDGEFKIRANHDWSLSWGGSLDAMTSQNGANLPISAGTYKFSFKPNCDGQGVLTVEAQ
ncbi:MAG: DUF5115 domain-containing protein [Bacteroidaceae bacterium]|nr:DUF5115 domain-containing protein [Bacteroidaceae bacterium]